MKKTVIGRSFGSLRAEVFSGHKDNFYSSREGNYTGSVLLMAGQ